VSEQTISEREIKSLTLNLESLLCKTKRIRHKTLKKKFSYQQRSILVLKSLKLKRTKPLSLDPNRTTTKLKENLKDKQEKPKTRKINQV